jgi:CHAD domain-containing protein
VIHRAPACSFLWGWGATVSGATIGRPMAADPHSTNGAGDVAVPTLRAAEAPAIQHLRRYLEAQVAEISRTDPLIRAGDDSEAVHDFRVAVRRTRSVLRSTRELYDREWLDDLRGELRWIAGEMGDARDLDVLLGRLRADARSNEAPVLRALETERRRALKRARTALASERYAALRARLDSDLTALPVRSSELSLKRIAARDFAKLRKEARKLGPETPAEDVHRIRIRAKRARYAAELAASADGRKRVWRFVAEAKRFQDVVGAHQDAVVAEGRIRGVAERAKSTATAYAAGRLAERLSEGRRLSRRKFHRAWRRLERRGRKAWA